MKKIKWRIAYAIILIIAMATMTTSGFDVLTWRFMVISVCVLLSNILGFFEGNG